MSAPTKLVSSAGPKPARHVLIISAAFPPTGGPGVQRVVKFAKYLPSFGWQPFVWTVESLDGLPHDPTLLGNLPPEVTIHATPLGGRIRAACRSLGSVAVGNGMTARLARALDWRVESWLTARSMPDDCVPWARESVGPLTELIRRRGIELIYSTFPHPSNHLLGLAVKRRTGLPWVADFRDLWTDDYRYLESKPSRRRTHRRLEQRILEVADVVVGVTGRQTAILAGHVPQHKDKFFTVTNGFDPEDFRHTDGLAPTNHKRFVLAHVGRFDRWRTGEALMLGVKRFTESLGEERDRFELRIVGHGGAEAVGRLREMAVRHTLTGYLPHAEAVAEMIRADALLLSVPGGPNAESVIPAKLFEYLASRRPILVVGPKDGECERIIRSYEAGLAVSFDENAVAAALEKLYRAWHRGDPLPGCDASMLTPFSRVELTGKLVSLLDGLVDQPAPPERSTGKHTEACSA